MRKKVILWIPALILLMSATSVNAQVIIGGNGTKDPHAGAGLDLSPLGADKLGLLLPNVKLTDDAEEFALVAGATDTQKEDATGMLVYNTEPCAPNGIGLYVWNGAKWNIIMAADYSTVTDVEGNTYSAARFGCAGWWMTENLRTTTGLTENGAPGMDTSNKYYWYPGQNSSVTATTADDILDIHPEYGLLYTWAAASGRTDVTGNEENKSDQDQHQGICPDGWHLPSDYEWNQLEKIIAEDAANIYSTTAATTWYSDYSIEFGSYRGSHGQKMNSTTPVNSQATNGTSKSRTENGFDALLVGSSGSPPTDYGTYTFFWSSSSYNTSYAWNRLLYYSNTGVNRFNHPKSNMFSVRCKKDE